MRKSHILTTVILALLGLILAACSSGVAPAAPTLPPPQVVESSPTPLPLPTQSPTPALLPTTTEAVQPAAVSTVTQTTAPQTPVAFPDPNQFEWRSIASGLERPVLVADAGDSSGRLFIVEQQGTVRILQNGSLLEAPFLHIRNEVGSRGNEQGLLGLAFHPKYSENGFFYVNYTDLQGNTVIARFQVSSTDPNQADPSSETRLLYIPQPYSNHNGGEVVFGPDGYLYLGLGDGGSAGDPKNHAQSLQTDLGKILRIDVDQGAPYSTPAGNIFKDGQLPEIWAYGLRNPWRFSFDRQTGDLYIGDVGQDLWEEIDFLPAGSAAGTNFGWPYQEGNHPYRTEAPPTGLNLIPPIYEYNHSDGCSVTGGFVYRGSQLPEWNGIYLFSDYCSGWVRGLLRTPQGEWQEQDLFQNLGNIASFGEDQTGELYLVDLGGNIYQLVRK